MLTLPQTQPRPFAGTKPDSGLIRPLSAHLASHHTATPLLSQTFGPWPYCQALVWEQLVDFASWTRWMPSVRAVNRLDSGPVGRGSRIQVDKMFHSEVWEVIHWHCHHRLDIEIVTAHCRVGFSVRLEEGIDSQHASIRLDCESEHRDGSRLLGWISERRLQHGSLSWLRGFSDYFLAQKPLAD